MCPFPLPLREGGRGRGRGLGQMSEKREGKGREGRSETDADAQEEKSTGRSAPSTCSIAKPPPLAAVLTDMYGADSKRIGLKYILVNEMIWSDRLGF
jgi:hypothetical protein